MQLQDYQQQLLQLLDSFGETDYATQFHTDLSPAGWHVGHCVYTESYWIREQLLQTETLRDEVKHCYVPELSIKSGRGEQLPAFSDLTRTALESQAANLAMLTESIETRHDHLLLRDNFLVQFLMQHYAQHAETLQMIRAQKNRQSTETNISNHPTFQSADIKEDYQLIEPGNAFIGSDCYWHYDNEKPAFECDLQPYAIRQTPVSNAEYLAFIEDGAYTQPSLWTEAGWQWLNKYSITAPEYWQSQDNEWLCVTPDGVQALQPDQAVYGLSWYEANAVANWANARLPHEYEWEQACRLNQLTYNGESWEWCENTLHPYAGFHAFPYDGYSMPYFDNRHYVLRGGSRFTLDIIKRPSFRNYYEADKRYIFAGVRLARDVN